MEGQQQKPEDRRAGKTKKAIRSALLSLLNEKPMDQITVTELAAAADINRKTFYTYYNGIPDAEAELENEIVEEFRRFIATLHFERLLDAPSDFFFSLTELMTGDPEVYEKLLTNANQSQFLLKIISVLQEQFRQALLKDTSLQETQLDMILDFTVPGLVNLFSQWFRRGKPEPPEEFSRHVSLLIYSGVTGLVTDMKLTSRAFLRRRRSLEA